MKKSLKINIPEGYEIDSEKSSFTEIVFKPINSLKTWEDCIKLLENKIKFFYFITNISDIELLDSPAIEFKNYNLLPLKEIAKKFLTLQKLYTCRQAYIGEWKPDWSDGTIPKYCIINISNNIQINDCFVGVATFSFPNKELAEEFLKNFEKDLEFIKEFL